jgi:integrase
VSYGEARAPKTANPCAGAFEKALENLRYEISISGQRVGISGRDEIRARRTEQHQEAAAKVLQDTKLEPFVIYTLRHTCLTRWAEKGMNPYELMRRAGRADFATTMHYVHMANPEVEDHGAQPKEVQGSTKSPHRADFTVIRGRRAVGSK